MHAALTAVGVDRPGIVAAVTAVLFERDCNIEDSRMAMLGGHFAMMLIVDLPDGESPEGLERALAPVAGDLGVTVAVRPVAEATEGEAGGEPYVLRVYGADRPGIVARVSGALAERGVSIADLATHVVGGEPPVYVMIMEVEVPSATDAAALDEALRRLAGELSVDLSLRPADADTL